MSEEKLNRISRHWKIAEFGKLMALERNYEQALSYYRLAIKEANQTPGQELAARHYAECCLEVLEHTESYEAVISYCDQALDYYEEHTPSSLIAQKDQICLIERKGLAFAKQQHAKKALALFEKALGMAKDLNLNLPISKTVIDWYRRGYQISTHRLNQLLAQHTYYAVRKDTVHPEIALKVPEVAHL